MLTWLLSWGLYASENVFVEFQREVACFLEDSSSSAVKKGWLIYTLYSAKNGI
jgi:hypothetical protein